VAVAHQATGQQDRRERVVDVVRDLRHLIETANAPILGEDMQGSINEWNAAAERLTGFSRAEVLGRSFAELVPPG